MKSRSLYVVVAILFVLFLAACGSRFEAALDYAGFISALKAGGSAVEELGEIEQPFFPVAGRRVTVDGFELQVFEFGDETAADEAAGTISPDGSGVGTSMVSWIEPPHFYKSGKLIVLYLGSDANITSLLSTLLGAQIAGGS